MDEEILVVGHAMMPKGTATRDVHGTLSLVAVVDRRTHEVLRASITLTTPVNRQWVETLLVGEGLLDDDSRFVAGIERDYLGPAQRDHPVLPRPGAPVPGRHLVRAGDRRPHLTGARLDSAGGSLRQLEGLARRHRAASSSGTTSSSSSRSFVRSSSSSQRPSGVAS